MKAALGRLFPHLHLDEWGLEKWLMLPLALAMLLAPASVILRAVFVSLGWLNDSPG